MPGSGDLSTMMGNAHADESRLARDRLDELAAGLDAVSSEAEVGATVALVQTATEASYPTSAGVYFYCQIMTLTGTESEGASGTTPGTGAYIYARNLGSKVPPNPTTLIAVQVGDRWLINYNG